MSRQDQPQNIEREKEIEKESLKTYNETMSNKIENQNKTHNARKEGFARKEENRNQ